MRIGRETAESLGIDLYAPTLVAPEGCHVEVQGQLLRPYCNGNPMSYDSCSPAGSQGFSKSASRSQLLNAQKALKTEGYDPGPADGIMGARTKEALGLYQTDKGLPVTGELDEATLEKLGIEKLMRASGNKKKKKLSAKENEKETNSIRETTDRCYESSDNPVECIALHGIKWDGNKWVRE